MVFWSVNKRGATCASLFVFTVLLLSFGWPSLPSARRESLDLLGGARVGNGSHAHRLSPWFSFEGEERAEGQSALVAHNNRALRDLLGCMQTGTCAPNQDKVVMLEEYHLRQVVSGTDWIGGEMIWANSTVHGLKTLGYTYLFIDQPSEAVLFYNLFPELVVALFADVEWLDKCWKDQRGCAKSMENPNGIPIWKMLAYYWWTDELSPLDGRWVLSPEPWPQRPGAQHANTYLGYSIDERCTQHALVPPEQREHRAYVFGKHLRYIAEDPHEDPPAWPSSTWRELRELGIEPVVSLKSTDTNDGRELPLPDGLSTLPPLGPDEFVEEVGKSKVLVGIGSPIVSPTPYEAMCMGVPFINPTMEWDESNPDDRTQWFCQHDSLCRYGPGAPYVYNVRKGDGAGLLAAIQAALEHPIERHIVERMTQRSVVGRLDAILQRDLRGMARDLLARRAAGLAPGELFVL